MRNFIFAGRSGETGNRNRLKIYRSQGLEGSSPSSGTRKPKPISEDPDLRAYIIGVAIGDGNLSNPNGRAVVLRISCDTKYQYLIEKISKSLNELLPSNKVGYAIKKGRCIDVVCSSNHWPNLLGWQAKLGSKFVQNVTIPRWVLCRKSYIINCLRGLIETDGSIYVDRGYKMVMFVTIIPKLAIDTLRMFHFLGFQARLYRITRKTNPKGHNQQPLYHIRLSKRVQEFLDLVKPEKL
jgi:hypothetical protein